METERFTRAQYLAVSGASQEERTAAHRRYYAQYVNDETKSTVARVIGMNALLKSTVPYLNDISLRKWDRLCGFEQVGSDIKQFATRSFPCDDIAKELGTWLSPSDLVCIAKEAARQLIEEHRDD